MAIRSRKWTPRVVIGWSERVDLPEWRINELRAKIDTGARTSAIHVEDVEELPHHRVAFKVVLSRKSQRRRVRVEAPIARRSRVRSSTGEYTLRYFVKTRMRLGPVEREIEISLVDRVDLRFRMLVGRSALEHIYLVDPARDHLADRGVLGVERSNK